MFAPCHSLFMISDTDCTADITDYNSFNCLFKCDEFFFVHKTIYQKDCYCEFYLSCNCECCWHKINLRFILIWIFTEQTGTNVLYKSYYRWFFLKVNTNVRKILYFQSVFTDIICGKLWIFFLCKLILTQYIVVVNIFLYHMFDFK